MGYVVGDVVFKNYQTKYIENRITFEEIPYEKQYFVSGDDLPEVRQEADLPSKELPKVCSEVPLVWQDNENKKQEAGFLKS